MDVFDLQAKITLDSSGFDKDLRQASSDMEGFGSKIEGILQNIGKIAATALGAAATGVSALIKESTQQFAEFEQLVGGVDTLFKDSSGKLQEYADNAFRTAGMSANDYMANATAFSASLISSLGGDTEAAVEYANRAMVSMSDNANKMGTDINSIVGTYQSLARGNFAMLDNLKLGYFGTKAELERLIADASTYTDVQREMGVTVDATSMSFDNIVNAISVVQGHLGIAGATAQEAATTIEGSVNSMKAAWENWLVGLGDENADLSGLTDNLITSVETVWKNVSPVLGRIKDSLVTVFADLTGIDLSGVLDIFDSLGASITDIGTAFADGGFSGGFAEISEKFAELTGLDMSGVTEIFAGLGEVIESVGAGFAEGGMDGALTSFVDSVRELTGIDLSGIREGIEETFSGIGETISSFFEGFDISQYVENILGVVEKLASGLSEMFSQIDLSGVGEAFTEMQTAASEAWQGIINSIDFEGIGKTIDEGIKTISSAVQKISDAFRSDGISGAVSAFIEVIATTFRDIGPKIGEAGENILQTVKDFVSNLGEYIYTAMPESVQGLIDALGNLFSAVWEYLQEFWNWMQPLVQFFTETFADGLKTAWDYIVVIIDTLIRGIADGLNFLAENFRYVTELMKGNFQGAADAVKRAWDAVLDFFGDIANGIMDIFSGLVSYMADVGKNMWEGLKSGFGKAKEWVGNIGDSISNAWEDFWEINSPSKKMARYGKFMAQGLEVGWNSEMDSLKRTMSDGLVMHGRVDFKNSAIGKTSAASINSMMSTAQAGGGNVSINLVVDGRTLATVLFDPLNNVIKQKGVPLGA